MRPATQKTASGLYIVRVAVLLLILAAIAVLLFGITRLTGKGKTSPAVEAPSAAEPVETATPTAEPTPEPTPPPVILAETEDMGQAYIDNLIFLGDSITYQMVGNGYVPFTQIWVPEIGYLCLFNCPIAEINYYPPDDPDNPVPLSIADCAATAKPEYLVIALGADGIAVLNEEEFKQYYIDVIHSIQEVSPDTKIICQSMLPVVDSLAPTGINNANINEGNIWIQQIAEQTGTRFLNTHEALLDSSGGLVRDFSPYDGIHLTASAYEVIFKYIRTHGYQ